MEEEGIKLLPKSEILTIEDFIFVINTLIDNGIEKVRITGGEPLIKKGIFILFNNLKKEKLKDISITTNGVLLGKYAQKLKDTGINRINVSLDTLDKEKFKYITRRDFFDNVVSGIKEAKKVGLNPIKINIVAIRGFNDNEIMDFVNFAIDNELHIRFIEFMPFGEFGKDKFISNKEIFNVISKKYKLEEIKKNNYDGPARVFKISNFNAYVGFISPLTEHFCSKCNRIRLLANGYIKTCLFSEKIYSIKNEIISRNPEILIKKVKDILKQKPKQHNINVNKIKFKKCQQEMHSIGG